ncbi:unnamed protein product [Fraxinus pennsylvanica]|uniref:Uncharacterized protein n=1 Tax=Fraxinus pennsylvanica TaxID=56036 RepID=A0AAD1ZSJ0_9LAMI|nr:unnamed protein product [Fraxinus pennsylvanica]
MLSCILTGMTLVQENLIRLTSENPEAFDSDRLEHQLAQKEEEKKDGVNSDNGHTREKRGVGMKEMALLEVVIEEDVSEGEDMSSLLGKEFAKKWRGPTRLLLLDEQYSNIRTRELPESIKVYALQH